MGQTSEFSLVNEDLRWEDRNDDRLLWRGSPTGMWHEEGYTWRNSHRVRLVNLTRSTIRSDEDVGSMRNEMLHSVTTLDSADTDSLTLRRLLTAERSVCRDLDTVA